MTINKTDKTFLDRLFGSEIPLASLGFHEAVSGVNFPTGQAHQAIDVLVGLTKHKGCPDVTGWRARTDDKGIHFITLYRIKA